MQRPTAITPGLARARILPASRQRQKIAAICLAISFCWSGTAAATDKLRIAVQKTGTFSWELAIMKNCGLDRAADLDLEITELASTEAAKIALIGGAADVILSDWLWVSRERSLGQNLTFRPYSSALGALSFLAIHRSRRLLTSTARNSPSPAVRSTRAGFCCRPLPSAMASIFRHAPRCSTGRRHCSPKRRGRARPMRP